MGMGCRMLDLTVINARNLKAVNHICKLKAYVVVSLDGNPSCPQKSKSPVDVDGGPNPTWSFNVKLYIDEPSAQQNRLTIHFKLRCNRALGDKDIGEVVIPVKELLDSSAADGEAFSVTYPVCVPSGEPEGELQFSYKFGDKLTPEVAAPKADVPVMGYPVWAGVSGPSGAGYQPPPSNGSAPPPPSRYAGQPLPPPPPAGHGYAQHPPPGKKDYPNQQAQQPPKKNKMGKELGVRFAGGHLIGDLVSHVCDAAGGF